MHMAMPEQDSYPSIAIVGIACRFPGARNRQEFWQNLYQGKEAISFFSDEELLAAGSRLADIRQPQYVKARAVLADADWFDAAFFGISPREAILLDPQQRLFLECAWHALEDAAYPPETVAGRIGVYAGSSLNTYLLTHLNTAEEFRHPVSDFQLVLNSEKDFLATRTSYKLNLTGPSMTIQTACSTSLVAIHVACQSLLNGECDLALAGGVSLNFPQKIGYLYHEGGIVSRDGHCRAFDAHASGTVSGDGVGILVLKRLSDAVAMHDHIYAVIRGSAVNNDGAAKVGYTAPSVGGQAEVIMEAQQVAGISAEDITYIEAHGTATPLGDPIEVTALTQVFRQQTEKKGYCALGSVKTNIGHLDVAAGVAGVIKTVLAMQHHILPPSLHFSQPNPALDLENSPFYVPTQARPWERKDQGPLYAGVSSFGIGGTNAHVILEEAPPPIPAVPSSSWQLLPLSAVTSTALAQSKSELADYLAGQQELSLADVAYTLQVGRKAFAHRQFLLAQHVEQARELLATHDAHLAPAGHIQGGTPSLVFLFPGQGSQYVHMGAELYEHEAVFRDSVDVCARILQPFLGEDIREVLYPSAEHELGAAQRLLQTRLAQPALFVIEYAMAQLWISRGTEPSAMIGHSIGEYVAACLAGVFSLEDALLLVAQRGKFMQQMAPGAMLSVALSEQELRPLLPPALSLAAVNAPTRCVVAGPFDAIRAFEVSLKEQHVTVRTLHTSHAFHSAQVDAVLEPFIRCVRDVQIHPPQRPFFSNVTGTWMTAQDVTDPLYWGRQMRQTVRFADAVRTVLHEGPHFFLEVGPGNTLRTFVSAQVSRDRRATDLACSSMRHPEQQVSDRFVFLQALGSLWLAGFAIDWTRFFPEEGRSRLSLPTYPFERQRYWPTPSPSSEVLTERAAGTPPVREEARPVAPYRGRQEKVAAILAHLLGMSTGELATTTLFLDLGVDSLLLLLFSQALQEEFGISVSLKELLNEYTTIELLATYLDRQLPEQTTDPAPLAPVAVPSSSEKAVSPSLELLQQHIQVLEQQLGLLREHVARLAPALTVSQPEPALAPPVQPTPSSHLSDPSSTSQAAAPQKVPKVLPLTAAQKELWFMAQLGEDTRRAYTESVSFHLHGTVELAAVEAALQALVARHEALRSTFHADGEYQSIADRLVLPVPMLDVSALDEKDRAEQISIWQAAEVRQAFDLVHGPLLRVHILRNSQVHHVLLLTYHHIIIDGWSIGVLLRELNLLYRAALVQKIDQLPVPMQYSQYVQWQTRIQESPEMAEARSYWLAQYARPVEQLALPTDYARPPLKTYNGSRVSLSFSSSLSKKLRAASVRQRCTMLALLLTGYQILLQRLSGQEDIVVGIPAAGQLAAGDPNLVGYCVNLLPVRCRVTPELSLQACIQHTKTQLLDAYTHQVYPFLHLIKVLHIPRSSSQTPLISTLFTLDAPRETSLFHTQLDATVNHSGSTTFDLSLTAIQTSEQIVLHCDYNTDLFTATTIERWLRYFLHILEQMADQPATLLRDLALVQGAELQQLLSLNELWPDPTDALAVESVQALFDQQAAKTPEAVAVVTEEQSLTYHELYVRANQLAHTLRLAGVASDQVVGLCLERSAELFVGMLGVLKAGGAYLPLDPFYPQERLAAMVSDAKVELVVTQQRVFDGLHLPVKRVLFLDRDAEKIAAQPRSAPVWVGHPDQLAYVIYTSGSTGRPKGVQVPHRGVINFLLSMQRRPGLVQADRFVAVTTLSFDIAVLELLGPLTVGAQVILLTREQASDGVQLRQVLERSDLTVMQATPTTWRMLLEAGWQGHDRLRILCGGEALTAELGQQLARRSAATWNMYGPTETTIWSLVGQVHQEDEAISIGQPIAHTQVYILDQNWQLAPPGVVGEIYIGGQGVVRGYLGRPDLTAERFIPDAWGPEAGRRLYRTGDLARYLPSGRIEFLGRKDTQVKFYGHRIELGEIEVALREHADVQEAVVLLQHSSDRQALVAYVVPVPGRAVESQELSRFLRQVLPDYMVPMAFFALDGFPMTSNGKVDRRAVGQMTAAQPLSMQKAYVAPRTAMEVALAQIWQEVFDLERVSRLDNFFEIGGDSILAVRVSLRAQERGLQLIPQQLFQYQVLEDLAAHMTSSPPEPEQSSEAEDSSHPPASPRFSVDRLSRRERQKLAAFLTKDDQE